MCVSWSRWIESLCHISLFLNRSDNELCVWCWDEIFRRRPSWPLRSRLGHIKSEGKFGLHFTMSNMRNPLLSDFKRFAYIFWSVISFFVADQQQRHLNARLGAVAMRIFNAYLSKVRTSTPCKLCADKTADVRPTQTIFVAQKASANI